jgi:hypothetical protein
VLPGQALLGDSRGQDHKPERSTTPTETGSITDPEEYYISVGKGYARVSTAFNMLISIRLYDERIEKKEVGARNIVYEITKLFVGGQECFQQKHAYHCPQRLLDWRMAKFLLDGEKVWK